uniref:Transposase n=1 Tax=Acrobeloides nanus TaxID=290746 RepID=A0A914DMD5_9BILA
MDHTWIGKRLKDGRRGNSLYDYQLWNCYDFTLNGLPRTNNGLEAFNNAFKISVEISHPTLSRFMNRLVDEHAKTTFELSHPPHQSNISDTEAYLIGIVKQYENFSSFNEYFNALLGVDIF